MYTYHATMQYDLIIIGGGQAGVMTAITLRQQKFPGSILLICEENNLPYQRPPLSKNFLAGLINMENLYIKPLSYFKKHQIDIVMNNAVTKIDRKTQNINLQEGNTYCYKKLVIATGSKLRKIGFDSDTKDIFYLKTIQDSIKIKSLMKDNQKIVIIGAGYIGLEIASTLNKKNNQIMIVEGDSRVMSRSVCLETSHFFEKIHEKKGVKFVFNTKIKLIGRNNNQTSIILDNCEPINTDVVIIGIGVTPNIELAIEAGIDCQNGILVNKFCQTSDETIYAVGDCANYPSSIYNQRLRLESVQNAIEQAKIAASKINDIDLPYDQIPWFWSDQYNIKLKIAGVTTGYENYVIRGRISEEKFSIFYLKEKRLIAIETINDIKSFSVGKKLIKNKISVPLKVLEDQNSDLKIFLN